MKEIKTFKIQRGIAGGTKQLDKKVAELQAERWTIRDIKQPTPLTRPSPACGGCAPQVRRRGTEKMNRNELDNERELRAMAILVIVAIALSVTYLVAYG